MTVKLLTEHHLEFLSLKRGSSGSSESTFGKMPHCWKWQVAAQISNLNDIILYIDAICELEEEQLELQASHTVYPSYPIGPYCMQYARKYLFARFKTQKFVKQSFVKNTD